jgi:uncharacterized protein (DUF433 family)
MARKIAEITLYTRPAPSLNRARAGDVGEFSGRVVMMQFPELVESRADVMMGKPCLKGTRIPVYLILEKLAAGETSEAILAAYPQLRPEHIGNISLRYAARLAAEEIVLTNQWASWTKTSLHGMPLS